MGTRLYTIVARVVAKGLVGLTAYLGGKYGEGQVEVVVAQLLSVVGIVASVVIEGWLRKAEQATE